MITGIFAFLGAFFGAAFTNYILYKPNYRDETYRSSGHY